MNAKLVTGLIIDCLKSRPDRTAHVDNVIRYVIERYPDPPEGTQLSGMVLARLASGERNGRVIRHAGGRYELLTGAKPKPKPAAQIALPWWGNSD